MKKFILFFAMIIIATSCQKSEIITPHYSPEQLEILHKLCDKSWQCYDQGDGAAYGCQFVSLGYKPISVVSSINGNSYIADGIFCNWFERIDGSLDRLYAYFKLESLDTMRLYTISSRADVDLMDYIIHYTPEFIIPHDEDGALRAFHIWEENGCQVMKLGESSIYTHD